MARFTLTWQDLSPAPGAAPIGREKLPDVKPVRTMIYGHRWVMIGFGAINSPRKVRHRLPARVEDEGSRQVAYFEGSASDRLGAHVPERSFRCYMHLFQDFLGRPYGWLLLHPSLFEAGPAGPIRDPRTLLHQTEKNAPVL